MTEHDIRAERDKVTQRGLDVVAGGAVDAQSDGRRPQQLRITGRLGRREQQRRLSRGGQSADLAQVLRLDAPAQRQLVGGEMVAAEFLRGQLPGEFSDRERITARYLDDPARDVRVERPCPGGQQGEGLPVR
jgi:hypothetical protein